MDCEVVRRIKESGKSTVELVRSDGLYIRKILKGRHEVFTVLRDCPHPYLPKIYEVDQTADSVTVIEEYIEGVSIGSADLSGRKLMRAVRELCDVLAFLHEKNIIHRDIKPSNILLAGDGHIRLIDFDAARMPKDDLEQDTSLLGTRGYAPPEQYGFAQTDCRADIYALGVTLRQLMGSAADRPRYRKALRKCTSLDPDKRYDSVKAVKRDLFGVRTQLLCLSAAAIVCCLAGAAAWSLRMPREEASAVADGFPAALPAPEDPHWDGETGTALWGVVPESGVNGEMAYRYRLYRCESEQEPDPESDLCVMNGDMWGNFSVNEEGEYAVALAQGFGENGSYYYTVSAAGDGVAYADSPYVVSDVFVYTGEDAPVIPEPVGLKWDVLYDRKSGGGSYCAAWENMDDYDSKDRFNVSFYDEAGNCIGNNIWSKAEIMEIGRGVWFDVASWGHSGGSYRFAVEVYSSRPNELRSRYLPQPVPEAAYSPWLKPDASAPAGGEEDQSIQK